MIHHLKGAMLYDSPWPIKWRREGMPWQPDHPSDQIEKKVNPKFFGTKYT